VIGVHARGDIYVHAHFLILKLCIHQRINKTRAGGPAYIYMVIEAMITGGLKIGLSR
jgi:hypothetical protein